jgi:ribonuclease VapC
MFVDASAWTAILLREPEREAFMAKLADAKAVATSALAGWETVRAVARETGKGLTEAARLLDGLQRSVGTQLVMIGEAEQAGAIDAHARFGKGVHPAELNMGDCFAYACARTNGVPLLYKGGDFALTDIEPA